MADHVLRTLAALGAGALLVGATPARGQTVQPPAPPVVDTSAWSPDTRQLWHAALAASNRGSPQKLREDSLRLAALSPRAVSAHGFTLLVLPRWEQAADSVLRDLAVLLKTLQFRRPLTLTVVPEAVWPVPVQDDRYCGTSAGPILFVPSGRLSRDTLLTLADMVLKQAVTARFDAPATGQGPNDSPPLGRRLSNVLVGFTPRSYVGVHRRAAEALRVAGREGWRECTAGDDAKCLRALFPSAEDSVTRFFGARDYRAHVLRDTFPLEVGLKQRCRNGDDDACAAWVALFELKPDLALPPEAMMSLTALALQSLGALKRLQAPEPPGLRPGAVDALVAVSGHSRESLARAWRDSLVASQRLSHDGDGRMALLAAPWILAFGLLAIGGRRDAK